MATVWDIISNKEAIAINQAWAGHPGRRVLPPQRAGPCNAPNCTHQLWAKKLPPEMGLEAALVINTGDDALILNVSLAQLGIPLHKHKKICLRDVWARRDLGTLDSVWQVGPLSSHDSAFVTFHRC